MKMNGTKVFAGIMAAAACLGLAAQARALGTDGALEQLGVSAAEQGADVPTPVMGYVSDPVPEPVPVEPVEWIRIPGGKFLMGTNDPAIEFQDAKPIHEVAVKTFEMSKTLVTVKQYRECVRNRKCDYPSEMIGESGRFCNYNRDRDLHPMNCVSWKQANQYARFKGARLPSESEWEYAATSGGKNWKYPWGNEEATPDRAVMLSTLGTKPVCSKPAGNTMQGLCDMVGNATQFVQDKYQDSYNGSPVDGSALENADLDRVVMRGGAFFNTAGFMRADQRLSFFTEHQFPGGETIPPYHFGIGFRIARSSR